MKVALVLVILVLAHGFSFAQTTKETKQPATAPTAAPTPKEPDPNFVRWRIYLDNLAQQLRPIPEERRPYASTEVGLAYLEVDREEAIRHLTIAVEEAYKLRAQDQKKFFSMLQHVVTTATRSGTDVAAAITAKLKKLEDADLDKTGRWPIDTEGSLLDSARNDEPARRAEHAKSIAPRGLKEGTSAMDTVFGLVQHDQALADDVYNTYMQKAAADKTIPLGALIQMGGYPFGYDEILYYGENGSTWGSGGREFKPAPILAPAYLAFMHARIKAAIERSREVVPPSHEAVNILFTAKLLAPEVERYAPSLAAAWAELEQLALVGRTPAQIKEVSDRIAKIMKSRAGRTMMGEGPNVEDEAEAILADIEKITDACQRDIVYSRAIIELRLKNPTRAEELADKMSDKERATNMRDIVNGLRIFRLVDNNELEDARAAIAKISTPGVKAAALGQLAQTLYGKKQLVDAATAADEAVKLFEKMDAADRPMMYFGLSKIQSNSDQRESIASLEKGIKALNKLEGQDTWRHKNLMEVLLSCPGQGRSMWATGGSFPQPTLLDAVRTLAKHDLDALNTTTDLITDKPTKLRAQAIIARAALAKFKPK